MLTIDGSFGEGGGQILRSSLALSMMTGREFRIEKIRARRSKPGLRRQHLTAVNAAGEVCGAEVSGAEIGSTCVDFAPGKVRGGEYTFSIGTAGSTTLVLQTVLLPLALASEPSRITLEGGTHNPFAPPFDFLARAYLPLIGRMGPRVNIQLERTGFYPAGGGRIMIEIEPVSQLEPFELMERGKLLSRGAVAHLANLPLHIAERELRVIQRKLNWPKKCLEINDITNSPGPGNLVTIEVQYEHVTEVFTGFGEIGRPAEAVATQAVQQHQRYLKTSAPAGEYLTDQLILPCALAGGGAFVSTGLSRHSETLLELIRQFLDVPVTTEELADGAVLVRFGDPVPEGA